jgi:nucleoside 2-deoxyribosyltransferase
MGRKMNTKRVFTAFAIEDKTYRDFLRGHALHPRSPFEFIDMSVKEPWSSEWKTKCRARIKGCDGVIALISKNTAAADGQLWEIRCAYEENIPTMLMWINDERPRLPDLIANKLINVWSWPNIENVIDRI